MCLYVYTHVDESNNAQYRVYSCNSILFYSCLFAFILWAVMDDSICETNDDVGWYMLFIDNVHIKMILPAAVKC